MAEFPKWPLVYVEWWDSMGSSSWQVLDDKTPSGELSQCRSVGWLAKKDKRSITLFSDLAAYSGNQHAHGHSEQVIPMGCVTKIKRIPFKQ